jgi:WD40 repeat protein
VDAGGDVTVRVWDAVAGEQRHRLAGQRGLLLGAVVIAPDGTWLAATAGYDATVRVWDAVTGEQRHQLTEPRGRACTPTCSRPWSTATVLPATPWAALAAGAAPGMELVIGAIPLAAAIPDVRGVHEPPRN